MDESKLTWTMEKLTHEWARLGLISQKNDACE
jgi:hypothetical protein